MVVLNLRATKAMMTESEGKPGAAAQILQMMRGDWRVRPALATTTPIHRPPGRRAAGLILSAEGNPNRVRELLGQEEPPPQDDRQHRHARLRHR